GRTCPPSSPPRPDALVARPSGARRLVASAATGGAQGLLSLPGRVLALLPAARVVLALLVLALLGLALLLEAKILLNCLLRLFDLLRVLLCLLLGLILQLVELAHRSFHPGLC